MAPLLRIEGITVAYSLANAWLQLYATPWWSGFATSENIYLAEPDLHGPIPQTRPYIDAAFQAGQSAQATEAGFVSLGILLLELCFGRLINDHPMWKSESQVLSAMPRHMARKMVSVEWLKHVQWQAGMDYAQAVTWCLLYATINGPDWTVEFARNVLEPLQRCRDECVKASQPRH